MKKIKKLLQSISYGNKFITIIRIILGFLFIFSGIFKAVNPVDFGKVLIQYGLLPEILIPYFAILIPFLELILGTLLVLGFRIKSVSFFSIIIMSLFTIAILINLIRGESFDCGCFELNRLGIGLSEELSYKLVARDILFIILYLLVFRAKKHYFSIDDYIEKEELTNI